MAGFAHIWPRRYAGFEAIARMHNEVILRGCDRTRKVVGADTKPLGGCRVVANGVDWRSPRSAPTPTADEFASDGRRVIQQTSRQHLVRNLARRPRVDRGIGSACEATRLGRRPGVSTEPSRQLLGERQVTHQRVLPPMFSPCAAEPQPNVAEAVNRLWKTVPVKVPDRHGKQKRPRISPRP